MHYDSKYDGETLHRNVLAGFTLFSPSFLYLECVFVRERERERRRWVEYVKHISAKTLHAGAKSRHAHFSFLHIKALMSNSVSNYHCVDKIKNYIIDHKAFGYSNDSEYDTVLHKY